MKDGLPYQSCPRCDLIRIYPQPTDEQLDAIYNGSYYKNWGESESDFHKMKRHTFGKLLDRLPRPEKQLPRFLDVGAATGIMMEAAKDRGYEVYGVEVSRDGAEAIAKKFGNERIANRYFDASFDCWNDGFFDVLSMVDLFEHVRSPREVLKKAFSLLAQSGFLLLNLPNTASFSHKLLGKQWPYYCSEHLFHFSIRNLKTLLERHGFETIAAKPQAKYLTMAYAVNILRPRKPGLADILAKVSQFVPQKFAATPLPVPVGQAMLVARKKG
jgi:2-polyprenyl-3-methyl-5-hydroxy-6-metoxy-1,4-benzoquinol methylase